MSNKKTPDRKFQELAAQINNTIIANDGLIGDQSEQVKFLIQLERKFKHHICKYQQAVTVYHKFIEYIVNDQGNILNAQPFFREKGDTFNSKIAKLIKNDQAEDLMQFDINHRLIEFIVNNWEGKVPERAKRYYDEFLQARRILIENNLPLAINRAKLFYRKTPKSHLTLLDLIGICTYGLSVGVDKFVGEYSKAQWANVCIGRMVGFMIEEYSKTFIRMYPTDKKVLYRANALRHRLKIEDVSELTKAVDESFEKDKAEGKSVPNLPIQEIHVRTLLNGSSYVSAESKNGGESEDEGLYVYDYSPDKTVDIEGDLIQEDLMEHVTAAAQRLTILEKKIIRLKGVEL